MILDARKNAWCYKGIFENLDVALAYIMGNDISVLPPGKHVIKGDDVFFSIVEIETKYINDALFEAHRKYLDIHCPISSDEIIWMDAVDRLDEKTPYNEETDCVFYRGKGSRAVRLGIEDFLVCFPQDIHAPAITEKIPDTLKKAIFKIKI